jgi:hypothetical protein
MTATDRQSVTKTPRTRNGVSPTVKATGLLFAAWCLGFAAVNAGNWPPEPYPTSTPPC